MVVLTVPTVPVVFRLFGAGAKASFGFGHLLLLCPRAPQLEQTVGFRGLPAIRVESSAMACIDNVMVYSVSFTI